MLRRRRFLVLAGLRKMLSRPGALLWTYGINLALALIFSLRVHQRFSALLDHSLASQRLTNGFDLGTLIAAFQNLGTHGGVAGPLDASGIPLYLIIYFILVPGTLFSYLTGERARLSVLVGSGLAYFWRFIRITLVCVLLSGIVLVPLILAQGAWAHRLVQTRTGWQVYYLQLPGIILIALVFCYLRLYFDLVEVYVVQAGQTLWGDGLPDRRVLPTLGPAWRTLRRNFGRAYFSFLLLAAAGFAAMFFISRVAVHMLAQPRVWPMFLLTQVGLFLMLFTRFWQRGLETVLAEDFPVLSPVAEVEVPIEEPGRFRIQGENEPLIHDPVPGPEPISPSLPEADPGVFGRDPRPGR